MDVCFVVVFLYLLNKIEYILFDNYCKKYCKCVVGYFFILNYGIFWIMLINFYSNVIKEYFLIYYLNN